MGDAPSTERDWKSPDGAGNLAASTGKDSFCSWLVARQRSTGDVVFLNWATWEVDWTATYNSSAKTGRGNGSGTTITGSGEGQGALTPVLVDPMAKDRATRNWV